MIIVLIIIIIDFVKYIMPLYSDISNLTSSFNLQTAGLDLLFGGAITFFGFSLYKIITGDGADDPEKSNVNAERLTNKAVISEYDARRIHSGDIKKTVKKIYEIPNDRRIANGIIRKFTVEFADDKVMYVYSKTVPTVDGNNYLMPWGSSARSYPRGVSYAQ